MATGVLLIHLGLALTTPIRAEAQDLCRDVLRTIDVEAVNTADPRALIRLAPSVGSNAVPALLSRTKSAEDELAFASFLAVGLSRHADALRFLRDAPRPKSPVARLGRSLALLAIGDGAETGTISHALYEGTVGERRRVAAALARMQQKRPQMILYDSLEDNDELVRLSAARALWPQSFRAKKVLLDAFKGGSTSAIKNRAANTLLRAGHSFRPEELVLLSPTQKARTMMSDAARGRRLTLRQLSAQIRANDPLMRSLAFASVALIGADTPAQMKKLEKTLMPKEPIPEAVAALALMGDAWSIQALEGSDVTRFQLEKANVERVLAVFFAFSSAGIARAQLEPEHAGSLARAVEGWMGRNLLDDAGVVRAIHVMERFDPLSGLLLARARLSGPDTKALRAAVRVIGRSGSLGDLPQLVDLARRGSPSTRSEALRAAARVCAR